MNIVVEQASWREFAIIARILAEAAAWAEVSHGTLWHESELDPENLQREVDSGMFFVARCDGEPAGTIKYQTDDALFWPDAVAGEAAYVHRLAVRRRYAGGLVSSALLQWAERRARTQGKRYLRLDTDMKRPKLRAVYERFGFVAHSERRVGPYHVMRYQLSLDRA